jgi:hypothetical protein
VTPIGGIGVQLIRVGFDRPTHRCCQETASFVTDRSTRPWAAGTAVPVRRAEPSAYAALRWGLR